MKWKQFFTPVNSIDWEQAHKLLEEKGPNEVIFLDVRQPSEYQRGHLPGAQLIPLGELDKRMSELEKASHVVIY